MLLAEQGFRVQESCPILPPRDKFIFHGKARQSSQAGDTKCLPSVWEATEPSQHPEVPQPSFPVAYAIPQPKLELP